jgi:hypothetical protein
MRGRWIVLAVLAAAGCDDSIYIEVRTADPTVESVELFVGADQCTFNDESPCDGLQPPDFGFHYPGEIYFHDPQDFRAPLVAKVDGGSAWFEFAASAATVRIIAVGRGGDAVRQAAAMQPISLVSGPLHVRTDLAPIDALGSSVPDRTGFLLWRTVAGQTCVAAENTNDTNAGRGAALFVVPDGDADCDDVPTLLECDPFGYLVELGGVDRNNPTCVQHFPIDVDKNVTACELGGAACSDLAPGVSVCGPTDICVPDSTCVACQAFFPGCIAQGLDEASTSITCTIEVTRASAGDPYTACDFGTGQIAEFHDDGAFGRNATGTPRLARLGALANGFQDSVVIDTGANNFLQLTPINFMQKSKFDLKLEGTVDPIRIGGAEALSNLVMEFMLEGTSKTPPQDVLLPLSLKFADTACGVKSTCTITVVAADSVLNCLKPP